jgi:hypothetical protein
LLTEDLRRAIVAFARKRMSADPRDLEKNLSQWNVLPEWGPLHRLIEDVTGGLKGRHPGIVTEAIVEAVTARFSLMPRETWHRERRRNHPERIRRLSHSLFRIIDDAGEVFPADVITASVLKAFIITPRTGESADSAG